MAPWPARIPAVLDLLDPQAPPRLVWEQLWLEVAAWRGVAGLWLSGVPALGGETLAAGELPEDIAEVAALAPPATAPIATDGLPAVARQLPGGGAVVVVHRDSGEAAIFLAEALARWAQGLAPARPAPADDAPLDDFPTRSPAMQALLRAAARAAASQATVLIQGETGTGKELLARWLHRRSARARAPLVAVNAAALAPGLIDAELFGHARGAFTGAERERPGLFEAAQGGTLFLDEVGEIGPETQVRLLRVLEERRVTRLGEHTARPVDVRVIAATNRDLAAEVRAGRFREDLWFRLNVVVLSVPPLRQRREDIPLLVHHFLRRYDAREGKAVARVPERVLAALARYDWPGNVRELENCIHRAVVLAQGDTLEEELLPPAVRAAAGLPDGEPPERELCRALERYVEATGADLGRLGAFVERALIPWALTRERGIKLRAAHRLGINRVTLDRKLAELGIAVRRGRGVVAGWPAPLPSAIPA